jgi:hypothetical protein
LLNLVVGAMVWPVPPCQRRLVFLAVVLAVDAVFRSVLAFPIRPRAGWFWLSFGSWEGGSSES